MSDLTGVEYSIETVINYISLTGKIFKYTLKYLSDLNVVY